MPQKTVPKKNIEPVLVDIRKPNFNYEHLEKFETVNLTKIPQKRKGRFAVFKRTVLAVLVAFIIGVVSFIGITFANIKQIKSVVTETGSQIMQNFNSSVGALKNFEPSNATSYLENNTKSLATINDLVQKSFGQTILDTLGNIVPIFKESVGLIGQVSDLNYSLLELTNTLGDLEQNGFKYFQNNGSALIADLQKIHTFIQNLNAETKSIKNATSYLQSMSGFFGNLNQSIGDQYLKYSSDLYGWDNMLIALMNFLNSSTTEHVAILFQNPSEIRPGGGFIGSYADLAIRNGQIQNLDVRDIYDPDGQLTVKVIPPEELQATTPNWGARDSNWFFDFPTSAKTAVNFLNISKMYSEKGIRFDAVIAININVVESFLDVTGPIAVPGYGTINSSNLLPEVQKETEVGADKSAGQPKKILTVIAPILMEKLNGLNVQGNRALVNALKTHLDKKDIMLYSTDPVMQSFLGANNLDGSVYELPDSFWGNYLAVVNANVAGGKSDAFIDESVTAKIDMDTSGNTFTNVSIARQHNGNTAQDPWWKAKNNDFIQIFTEPQSSLVDIKGNDFRPKYSPLANYAQSTYAVNPDLNAIQSGEVFLSNFNAWQRNEFGKNVFGAWLVTQAGGTKNLTIRYQSSYTNVKALLPGQQYTFIFERQSGVKNSLDLTINAPFKYYWVESNSPVFTYRSDDPDKRIIITLTLGYQSLNE